MKNDDDFTGIEQLKATLSTTFEMKDLGNFSYFRAREYNMLHGMEVIKGRTGGQAAHLAHPRPLGSRGKWIDLSNVFT